MRNHHSRNLCNQFISPSTLIGLVTLSAILIPVTSYFSEDLSSSEAFAPPRDYHHFPTTQENEETQFYSNNNYNSNNNNNNNIQAQDTPTLKQEEESGSPRQFSEQEQPYHHHQQFQHSQHQHHSHHYHSHHNHQSHHHQNHHFHHIQQDHHEQHQQQQQQEVENGDDTTAVGNEAAAASSLAESQEQQQHDGPHYSSHMSTNKYGQGHVINCRLPETWKGRWFQSGIPNPIQIDSKSIEGKGTCYEMSGDKFLFVEKKTCHRCVVINERHRNVLEYKESMYCEEKNTLDNLCSQIAGDAQLYSLFRIDAQPIDCPFKGPFLFSYNRGHGVCKSPMSRVDVCTEPSKLLLKYQACPDVPRTESTIEELQCLAEWRDSAYHYLVGKLNYQLAASNEDRYRCFMFDRTKGHVIKIAESGDATCIGLSSPTEGARTLTFTKIHESSTKCKFPSWVSMHHWHSLDGKLIVKTNHKNSSMSVSSEDSKREQYYGVNHNNHFSHGIHGAYAGAFTGGPFGALPIIKDTVHRLLTEGTRIQCQSTNDISEDHVAIVAHHTEGCTSTTVCMHLYRRDSHVIELQIRDKGTGDVYDYDCGKPEAMGPNLPYVTLISSGENSRRCPYLGKYMTTTITQDGRLISTPAASNGADPCSGISSQIHGTSSGSGGAGSTSGGGVGAGGGEAGISLTNAHHQGSFHSLVVGCGHRATMDFHSKCLPHEPITSYECHGSWDENGIGFLIASPLSRSSTAARRYCFSYSETDEGLQVYSSSDSCLRDGSPNLEGIWAFNLTVDGQCAEPVTTGGVTRTISCDVVGNNLCSYVVLLVLSTCFLQSSSLWMIASTGWMDQVKTVIVVLLTSPLTYFAKKVAAAFTLLIIELTLVLALSSKIVPFLSHNSPFRRTTHTETQHPSRTTSFTMMIKKISASLTASLTFPSRPVSSNSRNSTTCYAGGGGGDTAAKVSVSELMRE